MFQFFRKNKKNESEDVKPPDSLMYASMAHHVHQKMSKKSIEISKASGLKFIGHEVVSANGEYRILYSLSTGKCYLFKNSQKLKAIKLMYPGCMLVSNQGYFIICDLLDRDNIDGYFYVFDYDTDLIIKRYLNSNIHSTSLSINSHYASLQTEGNPEHDDGNKVFIFDLKANDCIGEFTPESHWSHHHVIKEDNQTVSFVFRNQVIDYALDGSLIEKKVIDVD